MAESRPADGDSDEDSRSSHRSSSRLQRLRNRLDWSDWKFKARAHFSRKKIRLAEEFPQQKNIYRTRAEAAQDRVDFDALQVIHDQNLAAEALAHHAGVAYVMATIQPVLTPPSRPETANELEKRVVTYLEESAKIWTDIVRCTEGEALTIVKNMNEDDEDGRAAFSALEERFGEAGTSSMFLVLKELLSLKQGQHHITKHVVKFEKVRQKVRGLNLSLIDEMFTVIFLQSLNAKFETFVTYTLLNAKSSKISCSQIMANAEEHMRTHGGDEADNKSVALEAATNNACKFGSACRMWASGRCTKFHPAPGQQAGKGKGQQGKPPRSDWWCETCQTKNFGHRMVCFNEDCKLQKPGRSQKRKGNWGGKGGGTKEKASMAKELSRLKNQLKTAKKAVDDSGVDIDIGFTAEERLETAFESTEIGEPDAIRFKCDSGASSHFSNFELPVVSSQNYSSTVDIADGSSLRVTKKAKFEGVTIAGDKLRMDVKQSKDFQSNLFSVKKATESDMRAVFDSEGSYLQHKSTGVKVPLTTTSTGWDLLFRSNEDGVT